MTARCRSRGSRPGLTRCSSRHADTSHSGSTPEFTAGQSLTLSGAEVKLVRVPATLDLRARSGHRGHDRSGRPRDPAGEGAGENLAARGQVRPDGEGTCRRSDDAPAGGQCRCAGDDRLAQRDRHRDGTVRSRGMDPDRFVVHAARRQLRPLRSHGKPGHDLVHHPVGPQRQSVFERLAAQLGRGLRRQPELRPGCNWTRMPSIAASSRTARRRRRRRSSTESRTTSRTSTFACS